VTKEKKTRNSKKNIHNESLPKYLVQRKEYREIKVEVLIEQLEKLREKRFITKKEFENRKKQIGDSENEIS